MKCPFQSKRGSAMVCDEENCALWCNDKCAIAAIAEALKIAQKPSS